MMRTLVRSVLSQDSRKSIAGVDARVNTSKARFDMHRNYCYSVIMTKIILITGSICLWELQLQNPVLSMVNIQK